MNKSHNSARNFREQKFFQWKAQVKQNNKYGVIDKQRELD